MATLVATPLAPSHYLELFNPLWATHKLEARVVAVNDETPDARTLTLRPGRGFRAHRAGQHVEIGVVVLGRRVTRTYSIASSPDRADGCITLTVKAIDGGRVSRFLVREARVGTHVSLGLPKGEFVLPESPVSPLFITGGSGITPIMSMLRTLALRGKLADVAHVHYAPSARDVIFGDELRALAAAHAGYRLGIIHTRDGSGKRLGASQLDAIAPGWRGRDVWACGPESLLDAASAIVPAERLHVERFRAARATLPEGAAGGKVRLRLSGVEADADARTPLLVVAERAGVSAPHGCRMGVCHTCDVTMVSGCVRDLRTGQRIDEPGARIQPCVCAAAGAVEIDL